MRISDWSSDVCSSDLLDMVAVGVVDIDLADTEIRHDRERIGDAPRLQLGNEIGQSFGAEGEMLDPRIAAGRGLRLLDEVRSEERRAGNECVSTCRSRWSP